MGGIQLVVIRDKKNLGRMIMSFLLPCVVHAVRVDLFRRYMMQTGVLVVSGRVREGHRRDDLHMSSARILKGNVN